MLIGIVQRCSQDKLYPDVSINYFTIYRKPSVSIRFFFYVIKMSIKLRKKNQGKDIYGFLKLKNFLG